MITEVNQLSDPFLCTNHLFALVEYNQAQSNPTHLPFVHNSFSLGGYVLDSIAIDHFEELFQIIHISLLDDPFLANDYSNRLPFFLQVVSIVLEIDMKHFLNTLKYIQLLVLIYPMFQIVLEVILHRAELLFDF